MFFEVKKWAPTVHQKLNGDLTDGPLSKLLELLGTQVFFGVRSVVGPGQEMSWTVSTKSDPKSPGLEVGSLNSTYLRLASSMLGKNKKTSSPNWWFNEW